MAVAYPISTGNFSYGEIPAGATIEIPQYQQMIVYNMITVTGTIEIICADNMERIRTGAWTVTQLVELTADPVFKNIQDDINGLSFGKIMELTNPIITNEIKMDWVGRLQANLFNDIEV